MSRPSALIAEDEPILRAELKRSLAELWPALVLCAEVGDGFAAIRALDDFRPDIVFLDIQMPGMTGLEVAAYANGRCHVAFVTAYDEYAVSAFEQGAIDYVMKPISPARLAKTVTRLKGLGMRKLSQLLSCQALVGARWKAPASPVVRWARRVRPGLAT